MTLLEHLQYRSPLERTCHAVLFEVIGIITSAPIILLLTNKSFQESTVIATIVSITAMIWNYIFNVLFDRFKAKMKIEKMSFRLRVIHGSIFEIGLILLTVPIIFLTMGLSLYEAFILELSMLLYFFPYTIIFNWLYDKFKQYWIQSLQNKKQP